MPSYQKHAESNQDTNSAVYNNHQDGDLWVLWWSSSASSIGLGQNGLNGGKQVSYWQCHCCTLGLFPPLSGQVTITFPCHHPPPHHAECLCRAVLGSLLSKCVRPTWTPCHITSSSGCHRPSWVIPLLHSVGSGTLFLHYIVLCALGFTLWPVLLKMYDS